MGLACTRAGSGPPLVLLHGIGHRRQAWDAVIGLLTPHRHVIAVDLPGHGESPPLDLARRTVTERLAEETLGFLDQLGLDRPHIAGNSLGGRLALEAAALGRVASVTALSPAGFWRSDRELGYAKSVFKVMQVTGAALGPATPALARLAATRALCYALLVNHPSRLSAEQVAGDAAAFRAARPAMNAILGAATPFTATLPADVPVTIAWGERDRLLPRRQALVARRLLPQATFVRLPGCGHVPMTDDPALVAGVLLRGSAQPRSREGQPLAAARQQDEQGRTGKQQAERAERARGAG